MAVSGEDKDKTADFRERVQALPPELFNEIYKLTFNEKRGVRHIYGNYKPPSCLQVDKQSRELFARTWYGPASIFQIDAEDVRKWLDSLTPAHSRQLTQLRINDDGLEPFDLRNANSVRDVFEGIIRCDRYIRQKSRNEASKYGHVDFRWEVEDKLLGAMIWYSLRDIMQLWGRVDEERRDSESESEDT